MGRVDGAGDAWKVGPANAAVDGVFMGFADDAAPMDWPVVAGVLLPLRVMAAGDVTTFLDFLLRDFPLDPASGALEFALFWGAS
jgi:hypothetical protein